MLLGVAIPTSVAITNILIISIVLFWFIQLDFKRKIKKIFSVKYIIYLFGLVFLYFLAIFWGDHHNNAFWQFQRLALLFLFPVFLTIDLSQKTIKYAVFSFLTTNFFAALIALSINYDLFVSFYDLFLNIGNKASISAFLTYNYHNILLSLSAAISMYLFCNIKKNIRYLFLLFIIVYAFSIFTEAGRAGHILFNISSLFYIYYYKKSFLKIGAVLLGLFLFQYSIYNTTNTYKERINSTTHVIKNKGIELRTDQKDPRYMFISESLKRIIKKPVFGYGTGSFGTIFQKEVVHTYNFTEKTTPHNQYLYVWFEIGIFGLILLLMIFYDQIRELLKTEEGVHKALLPISFLFLMLVDSYLFIFTLTITYIYLYIIYSKIRSE